MVIRSPPQPIYGLGRLLYELLTGKRPFQADKLNPVDLARLICETSPARPSIRGTNGLSVIRKRFLTI